MTPDAQTLLEIIRIQSEIAKLGLDLGNVMQFVAAQVQQLTNASGAVVELAEGEHMVYRAAAGSAAPQLGLRIKRAGSLSGLCIEAKEILICTDCESDNRVDRVSCRKVGLRSMVVSPLYYENNVVGVLKVLSPEVGFFTDAQCCVLRLMSDLIAASMFFATKYEIKELYYQATHDILTGLANRALFYDHLRQVLAMACRQNKKVGVLNLDMDGLKGINDQHGHRAGDAAIKEMAQRIKHCARASDIVARLGGDEFGIILSEVQGKLGAQQSTARMEQALRVPFAFEDISLKIEASIGIALFPEDANDIEQLLEKADQAMYSIKRTRKGTTR